MQELFATYRSGEDNLSVLMRRVLMRAICRASGEGLQVGPDVVLKHPETMEFGDCVFIGAQAMIQGRFDGTCRIGNHVWIGPQAYFDARNLVLEDYVGWGPGAKVLGSSHTGQPSDVPIIKTSLIIKPVRDWLWRGYRNERLDLARGPGRSAGDRGRGRSCHPGCTGLCGRCRSSGASPVFQRQSIDGLSFPGEKMNRVEGAKCLVTGGAGFVGSAIVDQLLDAGAAEVRVLDNFVRGNMSNLAQACEKGRSQDNRRRCL